MFSLLSYLNCQRWTFCPRRRMLLLMVLFALCGWGHPVCAQYRFDHRTTDNGLPQNSVRNIWHTRDGYQWLTTFDGLVRFDAVRFIIFNKSHTPGLASNRFFNLFENRSGDLWVSLETGQVVRRHQGRFTIHTQQDVRAMVAS